MSIEIGVRHNIHHHHKFGTQDIVSNALGFGSLWTSSHELNVIAQSHLTSYSW